MRWRLGRGNGAALVLVVDAAAAAPMACVVVGGAAPEKSRFPDGNLVDVPLMPAATSVPHAKEVGVLVIGRNSRPPANCLNQRVLKI